MVVLAEPDEALPPEPLPAPDVTPPECRILPTSSGETSVATVLLFAPGFGDPGVSCHDGGDVLPPASVAREVAFLSEGAWFAAPAVSNVLAEVTYRITYTATDAAGNKAAVERTVGTERARPS